MSVVKSVKNLKCHYIEGSPDGLVEQNDQQSRLACIFGFDVGGYL